MCLTSCNTFQKHLLSQKENLIFWPQKWIFEISEAVFDSFWHPSMRKWHCKATLKVSKKILRPSIKNRLDTFVPNVLGINLIPFSWSYDQNWLRETLKTEKRAKTPPRVPFWNNRLHLLTKSGGTDYECKTLKNEQMWEKVPMISSNFNIRFWEILKIL